MREVPEHEALRAPMSVPALRPPGKAFARVAVASTLCPGCGQRVTHRRDYTVTSVRTETEGTIRTRLIANGTFAIHACAARPEF